MRIPGKAITFVGFAFIFFYFGDIIRNNIQAW